MIFYGRPPAPPPTYAVDGETVAMIIRLPSLKPGHLGYGSALKLIERAGQELRVQLLLLDDKADIKFDHL